MKITQIERVKQYMEDFGSISSLEAFRDLGITRLAAVIFILKKQGATILTEMRTSTNRWGEDTRYAVYHLVKGDKDDERV